MYCSDHRPLEILAIMDGVQQRINLMILQNYESFTYLMYLTAITVYNQQYVQTTVSINTTRIIKVTKNNKQIV